MGPVRTALELRVELGTHEPGVVRDLHDLHQAAVGRLSCQSHALGLHICPVVVVELKAVAVTLGDLRRAVQRITVGILGQHAGVLAQTHGAALFRHVHLVGHQGNDRVLRGLGEFGGIGVLPAQHMAGELDDRHLHAQADAEIGDVVLTRIAAGGDHALDAPVAEAAGHQDAGAARQLFRRVIVGHTLGIHPLNVHHGIVGGTGVVQRLHHGEIGVVELGVLAYQSNAYFLVGGLLPLHHSAPLPQVRLVSNEP